MGKDFDFDAIGKRTPFRTPEGFFENVRTDILMRAEAEKRAKKFRRLRWGISIALAAAAIWCGFFFFPGGKQRRKRNIRIVKGYEVMDKKNNKNK